MRRGRRRRTGRACSPCCARSRSSPLHAATTERAAAPPAAGRRPPSRSRRASRSSCRSWRRSTVSKRRPRSSAVPRPPSPRSTTPAGSRIRPAARKRPLQLIECKEHMADDAEAGPLECAKKAIDAGAIAERVEVLLQRVGDEGVRHRRRPDGGHARGQHRGLHRTPTCSPSPPERRRAAGPGRRCSMPGPRRSRSCRPTTLRAGTCRTSSSRCSRARPI